MFDVHPRAPFAVPIVAERAEDPCVVLADGDPISRGLLDAKLSLADHVELVASVDSRLPRMQWPVRRPDLAILVAGPQENHMPLAEDLVANDVSVLMVGVDWTKHQLNAAFSCGVAGCLTKDWAVEHLEVAVVAAMAGYAVISPNLIKLHISDALQVNGHSMRSITGGRSLRSLFDELTIREREVLRLLAEGNSTAEASSHLAVSTATVKSHVSHSLAKLGVRNRLEAVLLMQAALGSGAYRP